MKVEMYTTAMLLYFLKLVVIKAECTSHRIASFTKAERTSNSDGTLKESPREHFTQQDRGIRSTN